MNQIERYFMLDKLIESNTAEIKRLKKLAADIPVADPSKEFISGGMKSQARFENLIDKAIELEKELGAQIDEYLDCKRELYQAFGKLKPSYELVLRYRYFDRMTVEEIAETLNCSNRHIYNLLCVAKSELFRIISQ